MPQYCMLFCMHKMESSDPHCTPSYIQMLVFILQQMDTSCMWTISHSDKRSLVSWFIWGLDQNFFLRSYA